MSTADRSVARQITFLDMCDLARTADNPPCRIYNALVRDPNGYLIEIQRRFWEPLV